MAMALSANVPWMVRVVQGEGGRGKEVGRAVSKRMEKKENKQKKRRKGGKRKKKVTKHGLMYRFLVIGCREGIGLTHQQTERQAQQVHPPHYQIISKRNRTGIIDIGIEAALTERSVIYPFFPPSLMAHTQRCLSHSSLCFDSTVERSGKKARIA